MERASCSVNALHRACVCKVEVDCLRHTIIYFIVKLILSSSVLFFSCVSCDIRKCLWRAQQALTRCVVLWCMQVGACSGDPAFVWSLRRTVSTCMIAILHLPDNYNRRVGLQTSVGGARMHCMHA